jgi:polyhydroxybutyrate depolymerase
MRTFAVVFRTIVAAASALIGLPSLAAWTDRTITVNDALRVYRVYQPASARANAPAVVVLHGGSQNAWKIFEPKAGGTLQWLAIAEREGIVLLVPNGTNAETGDPRGEKQNWNDFRNNRLRSGANDVAFFSEMIEVETKALRLNRQRIYLTGSSNGGMMAYRALIETPQRFAAAAAFVATMPAAIETLRRPAMPTPLLIMNGTADKLVRWDGGLVAGDPARGRTSSTKETLDWWVGSNRASETPEREPLPNANPNDACTISLDKHRAKDNGADVWLYTVQGGGHTMPTIAHVTEYSRVVRAVIGEPCSDVEGAEVAWAFMRQFERKN